MDQPIELKIAVIIPAAGAGTRYAASQTCASWSDRKGKIEIDLAGRPVFMHTVELFVGSPQVAQLVVAVDPDRLTAFKLRWGDKLRFHGVKIVPGGKAERWQTVLKALEAVDEQCTHVAVHDAVRPLASHKLIDRVFEAARRCPAVIPAIPVHGTLKRVSDYQAVAETHQDPLDAILGSVDIPCLNVARVVETVSRSGMVEAQTPQVFEIDLLRRAYAQITAGQLDPSIVTDDAGLIESMGHPVHVVDGEVTNLKITRAEDAQLATWIIQSRQQSRSASLGKKRLFASDDDDA